MDCKQWFGTVFTNDKAGMGAVDKDRIKNIVYEMSKDSAHFRNDLRKQSQTEQRVRKMKERASALSPAEIAGHTKCASWLTRHCIQPWFIAMAPEL